MSVLIENQLCKLRMESIQTAAMNAAEPESGSSVREMFRMKYKDLEAVKEAYLRTFIDIEAKPSKTFDAEQHHADMVAFMDVYYQIKVTYENCFGSEQVVEKTEAKFENCKGNKGHKCNVDLPTMRLPHYSGTVIQWSSYKAMFDSVIDNNKSLSPVQKMHYLISSLSGEAAGVIKHLPLSEPNYAVAYKLLVERYDNKRLMADAHIDEIINLPQLPSKPNTHLRTFLDTLKENLLALEALNMPVNHWSFILLHIVLGKLDTQLRNDFELHVKMLDMPTMSDMLEFMESRCKAMARASSKLSVQSMQGVLKVNASNNRPNTKVSYSSSFAQNCVCCNGEAHELYCCQTFLNMLPRDRKGFVTANRLCYNCLRPHSSKKCLSKQVCKHCRGFHHSLLHFPRTFNNPQNGSFSQNHQQGNSSFNGVQGNSSSNTLQGNFSSNTHHGNSSQIVQGHGQGSPEVSANSSTFQDKIHQYHTVLLATAIIHIRNGNGEWCEVRSLIDPGSMCTFASASCAKRLRLPIQGDSFSVSALGGGKVQRTDGWISCDIKPRFSEEPIFKASACIMQRLTKDLPSSYIPEGISHHFDGLVLADPTFYQKGKIDFLLGADLYDSILMGGSPIKLQPYLPAAIQTKLGFILMGKTNIDMGISSSKEISAFHSTCETTLEQSIVKFWEMEKVPSAKQILSSEDAFCEEHFLSTHKRDNSGRFSVQLPFKVDAPSLGQSKDIALRRFSSLERRLNREPLLKEMYCAFLKEYEELGHMTLIPNPKLNPGLYYIPHHGVLRLSSSSTKLRVVYDASSASSNKIALNQVLLPGPKLQQNIVDIITRFRVHTIVFTSDIKQMYRQINIQEIHRPYQRILWRSSVNEAVKEYELNTVTYGVTTAPFLAMRSLRKLAEDGQGAHAHASRVILQDIFVDDVVSGGSSLPEVLKLKDDLITLLKSGGFELRKWCSNSKEFLASIPKEHCEVPLEFNIDGDSVIKILGLKWNSADDSFLYTANIDTDVFTKRSLLSHIARLYDPCGWLAPVVFKAKSMMQTLWLLQIGWDETPPQEFIKEWKSFSGTFSALRGISIPRCIMHGSGKDYQLHAFSDASEKGFSGVCYLRVIDEAGFTKVFLLIAKSKVAPIKQRLTIPKMELNGALIAATLTNYIKDVLSMIQFSSVHIWCDSTIVLSWLCTSPHSLRMYEGNRVSQIHSLVDPSVWRYVPSSMNPADAASRGLYPDQLVHHPLWWDVPWLAGAPDDWPVRKVAQSTTEVELSETIEPVSDVESVIETTQRECFIGVSDCDSSLLMRYSSLSRLLRITSLCLRFIHNCRSKVVDRKYGYITSKEIDSALILWVKDVQQESFKREISLIANNKHCKGLDRLSPFMDDNEILRVGGRLKNSLLQYDAKHPMLLPRSHHLTDLIVDSHHLKYLHVGPSTLLSHIRQRFWVLSGRQVVRHRVFKCLRCFRARPKSSEPVMADLPSGRVQPSKVFSSVAADFAGPFYVKESNLRKARVNKAYLCIFVCFSTKASHLELVSDLSTEAFLAAFHRFISRRGLCRTIHTDNGTNYQGANNCLNEIYKYMSKSENLDKLNSKLSDYQVQWYFGPASAPHFNGLAESAVKSAKHHVLRVVGEQRLTFEELSTLFCRVEAILNSRPLFQMSSDPHDFQPLTPGHFIIGCPLNTLPEHDLKDVKLHRLSRWQLIQKMSQGFWKQWSQEYLHTLQQRNKWTTPQNNFKLNDLVLIRDDSPPLHWKLGRVVILHPGKDTVVRAVTVKTQNGTLVRPVVKLCLLPQ